MQVRALCGELELKLQSSALAAAEATAAECDKMRAASAALLVERDQLQSDLRAAQRNAAASQRQARTVRLLHSPTRVVVCDFLLICRVAVVVVECACENYIYRSTLCSAIWRT